MREATIGIILEAFGKWLTGTGILSGYVVVIKWYEFGIKDIPMLEIIIGVGWSLYCISKGYLKYLEYTKINDD